MAYIQQLLKGLIDPIILSVISRLPMYGYQIVKELEKRTVGRLQLKRGTVYPSLLRLERNGLVISKWKQITKGRGRRYYEITEKGRQFLASRSAQWHDLCAVVNGLIKEPDSHDSTLLQ
ncbi:MAG: PadR family transcriptional regulator [Dehalococcoidia bacterium]|nr:PadR family transcriptional regulator [Dehalococcoidia bacterium]